MPSKPKRGKAVMSMAELRRQIIASQKRIASERDRLRDLISDAEQIASDCADACEYLNYAADRLSELQ